MQNKYTKLLIIILAVAIVVPQVTLAAWWNPFSWGIWNRVFHFQRTEQKQEQQQSKEQQDKQTAGWKAYANSQYGFEFEYPADWVFSESKIAEGAKNDLKMGVWVVGSPKGKTFLSEESSVYPIVVTAYDKPFDYNQYSGGGNNPKVINGTEFIEFNIKGTTYPDSHFFILDLKNRYIQITDDTKSTDSKLASTFNQILSTFKFTNAQPVVGGDKDSHGCIGSAGYTWCAPKQKCLRTWEEKCCIPEGGQYGAPASADDFCCDGLVRQPTTNSGTVGICVKQK